MSHIMNYEYIELDRSFHELSKWASENDENDLTKAFAVGPALLWRNILTNYRTIILSEAGSGKTAEIMHQARTLEKNGKRSFFMRLENVARDFEVAFEVGSPESFDAWLNSMEEGWVFLDSVDEARLKNPNDFQLAVRHIGRRLMKALDRTHVVITGRTSAWRAKSDYLLCLENLPITFSTKLSPEQKSESFGSEVREVKEQTEEPAFKIVALDSLSENQIRIFAKNSGVSDVNKLLTAIERADAAASTSRPQDLIEVISFWKKNGSVGTRYDLMQFSIDIRLAERDVNRDEVKPLSSQTARRAAKLIAAATTLSRTQSVLLPDHEPGLPGISLAEVLPEWDAADQTTLLSRPIFDEAIYGSVRFYHRTVREYLTAEWLSDLLKKQTSRKKIYQILFRSQYGLEVIPPTMRPVLAWLVLLDADVCIRVLKIAPEIVLEGGDPARLPVNVRRNLLNDICRRVALGTSGRTIYDYGAVQRFANNDIADEVSRLLEKHSGHNDISWFLLRMVWIGELVDCLPQAKKIALNPRTSLYTRTAAFKAVAAVGTEADRSQIRASFLRGKGRLKRAWLGELLSDAPHTLETMQWLTRCISRAEDPEPHGSDALKNHLVDWIAAAPEGFLLSILGTLAPFLSKKPVVERRHGEISKPHGWLMKPLCKAAERLIFNRNTNALDVVVLSVLQKVPAAKAYDIDLSGSTRSDLRSLVIAWPELNRALFWYAIAVARRVSKNQKPAKRVTNPWEAAAFDDLWNISDEDFQYFIKEVGHRDLIDDKLVALTAAIQLFQAQSSSKSRKKYLSDASKIHPELAERLDLHFNPPPPTEDEIKWRKQERVWKKASWRKVGQGEI